MTDYTHIDEEVAAAEAALKAAQDRLEAARAKQAQVSAGIGADDACQADRPFASPFNQDPSRSSASAGAQTGGQAQASSPFEPPYAAQSPWQTYGQPGAQSGAQPYGQPYAQTGGFSSQVGQAGQPYAQADPYAQPYSQAASQPGYAQAAPQTKDHVAAGLLAIFLGCLGTHKFYLGYNTPGFIMLAVTVIGSIFSLGIAGVVMLVVSIVEGVIYLSKSQTEFERIYVFNQKEWF